MIGTGWQTSVGDDPHDGALSRLDDVTTHDVVSLRDGKQYDIKQIQYPPDIYPRMMDLSLERRADKYDVAEVPT